MSKFDMIGEIDSKLVKDFFEFVDNLYEHEIDVPEVTIRIFSGGGDPDSALAIVGLIKSRPDIHWITEAYGGVESAASLIFAAGTVRRMSHAAFVMVHPGTYRRKGTAWDITAYADFLRAYEDHWAALFAQYTESPDDDTWVSQQEQHLFAKQCLDLNLATEII
jgi:ATP-dependent protease ClpP protease subunit